MKFTLNQTISTGSTFVVVFYCGVFLFRSLLFPPHCRLRLRATLRRLGVRAGERKSSDGRQTFKFLQNFPRADTPTDAKPLVSCSIVHISHKTQQFQAAGLQTYIYRQFFRATLSFQFSFGL